MEAGEHPQTRPMKSSMDGTTGISRRNLIKQAGTYWYHSHSRFHRKLAPYVGVSWHRKLGEAADLAQAENEETDAFSFLIGIRARF